MDLEPNHWVWQRERPAYHGGAARLYPHEKEQQNKDLHPKGPNALPHGCDACLHRMDIDCDSSNSNESLFLSSIDSDFFGEEIPMNTSLGTVSVYFP